MITRRTARARSTARTMLTGRELKCLIVLRYNKMDGQKFQNAL
jgi:hypothetical protein